MRRPLRTTHARIWTVLAILLPAALVLAMVIRQDGPIERPAQRLAPPPPVEAPSQ